MTYTHQEALDLFKRQGERERDIIRRIASRRLVWQGYNEIASADVDREICNICNEYEGAFSEIMYEYLEDFLRGYKSLS
jgi:hypothetical protein